MTMRPPSAEERKVAAVDAELEAGQQADVVDVQTERILLTDTSGQISDKDTSA